MLIDGDASGRSFPYGRFFFSVLCALLVHALFLGAVRAWFGPESGGAGGPQLISLELGGAPGGGGGGDALGDASGFGDSSDLSLSGASEPDVPSASTAAVPGFEADAFAEPQVADSVEAATPPLEPAAPVPPVTAPEPLRQEEIVAEPVAVAEPVPSESPEAEVAAAKPAEPVSISRKPAPEPKEQSVQEADRAAPSKEPTRIRKSPSVRTDRPAASAPGPRTKQVASSRPVGVEAAAPSTPGTSAPGSGSRFVPSAGQGAGKGGALGDGSSTAGGGGRGDGIGQGSGSGGGGDGLMSFGSPGGPGVEHMVLPEYPREARRLGKEGVVVLKLSLDADGMVESVEVLETPGYGLDDAAREAVQRSRFHPATVGGVPVACRAILPINFRLR